MSLCVIDQEKGDAALLLKPLHKFDLMRMDILQGKGIYRAFFGVKADRKPLHCTNVIDGALLFKIGKSDLTMLLVHFDRCDRCGNLLDQRQSGIGVFLVCPVDHILQRRSSQASGIPCCHLNSKSPLRTAHTVCAGTVQDNRKYRYFRQLPGGKLPLPLSRERQVCMRAAAGRKARNAPSYSG